MVSFDSFLCKVLDDPTDWTARPYSPLEGALPPLFQPLTDETISHYRDVPWFEEELSFIACTFTSHLSTRFRDDFETQAYNPHRFAHQFCFVQGVPRHLSTPALPTVVASLAFKSNNLVKVVVSSSEVPFTSPSQARLPLPRFKEW